MDTAKNRAIGACLRQARKESGLTQVELASRLTLPQSFVSKLESGERSLHVSEFFTYAAALGVEPQDLFSSIELQIKQGT